MATAASFRNGDQYSTLKLHRDYLVFQFITSPLVNVWGSNSVSLECQAFMAMAEFSFSSKISLSIIFLLSISTHANSQEQQILLQIKQDWGNPPQLRSWNTSNGNHCTSWQGVQCDTTNGSVTGILFPDMNFTQPIPAGICNLSNLTFLNLALNYIPGNFPTHLYNCSRLQYLNLSQNNFVGPIPSDIYRLSADLRYLDLGANNFSGDIPAGIGRFSSLQVLNLHQNLFNGSFPAEIGNLSNLEQLWLQYNSFIPAGIPQEFGQLKKLQDMQMILANLVGEIPESFANLTELRHLDISSNNLNGKIPNGLFKLKTLSVVYLFENELVGEIPSFNQALALTDLDLSINQLTGNIPEDIGKLENLTYLQLYANQLSGQIPASLAHIPALVSIKLFKNRLTGILPLELGLHSKLEGFEAWENQLSGHLPGNFCAGGVLRSFSVSSNKFTGVLPNFLGECRSLEGVQVHKNAFSGEVPRGLWGSENLTTLMMSDNLFTGVLPDKLAWNLSRLEIENNKFTGNFPANISYSKNLVVIKASNNLFSGDIPVQLTALSVLENLLLDHNRISGEIPEPIISWKELTLLNLSNNNLTGKIPPAIGKLPALNTLDISENHLTGNIPPELGLLKLSFLNLSENLLTGRIPADLLNPANDQSFMSNPDLCAQAPTLNFNSCISEPRKSKKLPTGIVMGILILAVVVLTIATAFALIVFKRQRKRKPVNDYDSWKLTSFQRLDFTESNILRGLTETNVIGKGGTGKVYRVAVGNREGEVVAVKRIRSGSRLDARNEKEFEAEVEILGRIRHSNIVKLLCCISREDSNLLVYEYMENGSLDQWIHGGRTGSELYQQRVLDWPTRFKIAVGAAQGLCYMHHGCSPSIIHRDVKSSNILLDSEFKARIADFGLSRMLVKSGEPDTMSAIAGSFGYIAPEYAYSTKISEKSDVYSFGVVLLELVTGRGANDTEGQTNLAEWAWRQFQESKPITDAFDKEINEASFFDEMSLVLKLGIMCTATLPSTRPSMKDALQILLQCTSNQSSSPRQLNEHDDTPLLHIDSFYREGGRMKQTEKDGDEVGSTYDLG